MDVRLLDDFADHLNKNCQATLLRFLSLQVNGLPDHKALLKTLKAAVFECDAPDENTLQGGLDILKQADLRPVLSRLTIPVSVILGGLDTLVPVAVGQKMQQLLPGLELNIIDRAGHVPFLSHSRETLAIISRFMDQQMYLDKAKIRQSFAAASVTYDGVAALQRTVGKALLRILSILKA